MPLLPVWDEPEGGDGGDVVTVLMTIRSVLGTLMEKLFLALAWGDEADGSNSCGEDG